jgi:hypothetical protein
LAQQIAGCTAPKPANVPKPQSVPESYPFFRKKGYDPFFDQCGVSPPMKVALLRLDGVGPPAAAGAGGGGAMRDAA